MTSKNVMINTFVKHELSSRQSIFHRDSFNRKKVFFARSSLSPANIQVTTKSYHNLEGDEKLVVYEIIGAETLLTVAAVSRRDLQNFEYFLLECA